MRENIEDRLLVEANHRCTVCGEEDVIIHHIIPKEEGGTDTEDNLIVLCQKCHDLAHSKKRVTRGLSPEHLKMYKERLKEKIGKKSPRLRLHYSIQNVKVLEEDKTILFDLRLWISNIGHDAKHLYARITTLIFGIRKILGEKLAHNYLGQGVHEFIWREDTGIFYKDYSEDLGILTLCLPSRYTWGTIKLELRAENMEPKFKEIEPKRDLLENFYAYAIIGTTDQPYSEEDPLTPISFTLMKRAKEKEEFKA